MAVTANTNETYDVTTIREDLQEALTSISPTDNIFMSTIGSKTVDNTYFEFGRSRFMVAADIAIEGDVGLTNSAPTMPFAKATIHKSQLRWLASSTNESVNGVANAQTVAKQVA